MTAMPPLSSPTTSAAQRGLRLALVVVGLGLWFTTQWLLGKRHWEHPEQINDLILNATAPWNDQLHTSPGCANALLIVSSAVIDVLTVGLLAWSVVGPSVRPFLGLLMLFMLRQACQMVCALPTPPGMIWRDPGFPSAVVTYGVDNDFFFSGHTALAVYGAVELARLNRWWCRLLAVVIACFEAGVVLVLRAHWTMDVYAGAVTALYIAGVAKQLAPTVDCWFESRFAGPLAVHDRDST